MSTSVSIMRSKSSASLLSKMNSNPDSTKHEVIPEDLPKLPTPRKSQVYRFNTVSLEGCISTLENYSVQMLSEMKTLIDLLPKILLWHMQPTIPTDSDYVNLVKEMLEAYKEGLGLILIGFYNKRPAFLTELYSKHGREVPPQTLKLVLPGAKDLLEHPLLFNSIETTFEKCMAMSETLIDEGLEQEGEGEGGGGVGVSGGQGMRKSLAPGHSFFQSLQNFRQSTKANLDQGRMTQGAIKSAKSAVQKESKVAGVAAADKEPGEKGKKGKKGKGKRGGKGKKGGGRVSTQEPYLDFETTRKISEGQEYYDRFISCMQKCLLSVVDCLEVIEKWTCLCQHKHWVSVYDFLITTTPQTTATSQVEQQANKNSTGKPNKQSNLLTFIT